MLWSLEMKGRRASKKRLQEGRLGFHITSEGDGGTSKGGKRELSNAMESLLLEYEGGRWLLP